MAGDGGVGQAASEIAEYTTCAQGRAGAVHDSTRLVPRSRRAVPHAPDAALADRASRGGATPPDGENGGFCGRTSFTDLVGAAILGQSGGEDNNAAT